jgi:isopenicillin N synthase-like dioxygenase
MDSSKSKDALLPSDPYELYGDNQWPDEETLSGFSEMYIKYCVSALDLCRKMMKIFALALGLPETYFDSSIRTPGVTSRMMHYPAQPVAGEVQEGLGAHTVSLFEIYSVIECSLITFSKIGLGMLYGTLSGESSRPRSSQSQG